EGHSPGDGGLAVGGTAAPAAPAQDVAAPPPGAGRAVDDPRETPDPRRLGGRRAGPAVGRCHAPALGRVDARRALAGARALSRGGGLPGALARPGRAAPLDGGGWGRGGVDLVASRTAGGRLAAAGRRTLDPRDAPRGAGRDGPAGRPRAAMDASVHDARGLPLERTVGLGARRDGGAHVAWAGGPRPGAGWDARRTHPSSGGGR